jgi:sugar lactone lactonase YvrE
MSRDLRLVAEGFSYLECPRWHDGRLWLSDFYTQRVVTVDDEGRSEMVLEVPQQPSGLGWLPDGRLLVVSMRDRKVLRQEASGELVEHADLSALATGHLNDMVVDSQGRAYVGNFGFDLMAGAAVAGAALLRVDPDGQAAVAAEDLLFPNGSAVLPDGTLVVAETFGRRISAFDVADDGTLENRRTWASFGPPADGPEIADFVAGGPGAPDGLCADEEGAIWLADALGARVLRVRESGEVLDEISTGGPGVFACMLGGEDRRTLYLCVAPSFAEHERRDTRDAQLLSCRVDVPGAGLP